MFNVIRAATLQSEGMTGIDGGFAIVNALLLAKAALLISSR